MASWWNGRHKGLKILALLGVPVDNIVVEMAGTQVSGIDVGEVYNKKWQSPIGTRKYNKEAFIVIKNLTRDPFESSKPMDREHKPQHPYEPVTNV